MEAARKGSSITQQADAFLRAIAAATIAGAIAGIVAAGIGGRIAMRITALTAGDADQGAITEADEVVGVITFGGTMFLIVFLGIGAGLFGGLFYAGVRPWFRNLGAWRGPAFGTLLLATLGWTVIERDNFDFHRFGYATLNLSMFGALFVLFGVTVAPLYDIVYRRLPGIALSIGGVAGVVARAIGGGAVLISLAVALGVGGSSGSWEGLIPVYVLLGLPVTAALVSWRTGAFVNFADLRRSPVAGSIAVAAIALPIALGVFLDVRSIVHHLTAT